MKTSNEERYKKSFDNLHLSGDFSSRLKGSLEKEREDKKVVNLFSAGKIAAAIAICSLACGTACYACDVGGIRTNFNIWLNGTNQNIEVQDNGDGSYSWTDEDGHEYGFGGISMDEDGTEHTMTADEYFEFMNNDGSLEFMGDGSIIFHYHNLSVDVTDMLEDGALGIYVEDPSNAYTYFSFTGITSNGSYGCSTADTPEPGISYTEIDSSDLISGDPVPELDDGTSYSTYVSGD